MAGPEHVDPEVAKQLVARCAAGVLHDLRCLYPLADVHQLETVAVAVATDQVFHMLPMFHAVADSRVERIGLTLSRPSKLVGGKTEELKFGTPRDLEACATLNEVLSSATVYALLYCPSVRAMLAMRGYRVGFAADGKHLEHAQKVVSLDKARAKRDADKDDE